MTTEDAIEAEMRGEIERLRAELERKGESIENRDDLLRDLRAENAELRGEVERLTAHLAEEEAARYEWSVEDRAENEVLAAERDDLRAQLAAAQAQLAETAEQVIMRDKAIREWERVHWRDVDRMTAAIMAAEDVTHRIPSPFADNVARAVRAALSAAPQPEPETARCTCGEAVFPAQCSCAMCGCDDGPAASDGPR